MSEGRRLTRREPVLGGVCGGLAHFLNLDPTLVRVVFAAWLLLGHNAVLVYVLLWAIVPSEADAKAGASAADTARHGAAEMGEKAKQAADGITKAVGDKKPDATWIFGLLVLVAGIWWFLDELGVNILGWVDWDWVLPLGLVALGSWLMNRAKKEGEEPSDDEIEKV